MQGARLFSAAGRLVHGSQLHVSLTAHKHAVAVGSGAAAQAGVVRLVHVLHVVVVLLVVRRVVLLLIVLHVLVAAAA